MTIFRYSFGMFAMLNLSGCDADHTAFADACPGLSLGYELERLSAERSELGKQKNAATPNLSTLPNAADLSRCLTEQSIILSRASGSISELSQAVVAVCGQNVGAFEGEAITQQLEQAILIHKGQVDLYDKRRSGLH